MTDPTFTVAELRAAFQARQAIYQRKSDAASNRSFQRLNDSPSESRKADMFGHVGEMYQHTADSLPYLFLEITGEHLDPTDPELAGFTDLTITGITLGDPAS